MCVCSVYQVKEKYSSNLNIKAIFSWLACFFSYVMSLEICIYVRAYVLLSFYIFFAMHGSIFYLSLLLWNEFKDL